MDEKKRLRREAVARRDALASGDLAKLSRMLIENVRALPQYRAARRVLATMSIGSEWDTRAFVERARADGKSIVLPRITRPPLHLEIHEVADPATDLVPGVWDIPEPDPARSPRLSFEEVDFALVPALLADRAGYRLGYGAGYFDRLLTGRGARPFCVVALPATFIVEDLPHEAWDIPVDLLVSEEGALPVDRGQS